MNLMCPYRLVALIVGGVLACALVGCTPQDEPRRYKAPKEEAAESDPDMGTMGSGAAPTSNGLRLAYDMPKGWAPGKVGGMRRAAFVVQEGERKVEITAIDLAARAGALLPNVNRWRGQIQLGEITQAELDKAIRLIPVAGVQGHYVELVGPAEADSRQAILGAVAIRGERAWFFKLWGDAELALREKARFERFVKTVRFVTPEDDGPASVSTAAGGGNSPLKYDAPEGWTPREVRGMRRVAFHVAENDQKVEITAIELPGSVEALLPNVNRWRQQIELGEITQAELEKTVNPIQVDGVEGHYIELVGPEDAQRRLAMLRVVAIHDGRTWLFSMTGDADLVLREKERFQGFVRSVKLSADGAQDDE